MRIQSTQLALNTPIHPITSSQAIFPSSDSFSLITLLTEVHTNTRVIYTPSLLLTILNPYVLLTSLSKSTLSAQLKDV